MSTTRICLCCLRISHRMTFFLSFIVLCKAITGSLWELGEYPSDIGVVSALLGDLQSGLQKVELSPELADAYVGRLSRFPLLVWLHRWRVGRKDPGSESARVA
ncbi:hypothetical protein F5Y13DRAFT_188418 [Hypoxylon sp. FL1857]|nr:hypothetical protein F5Y13DRAFT_188418 [Hypoxylon sp. FL1857]